MKKIIGTLLISIILVGCSLGNTPISKTEDYLYKYQTNNKSINTSYTNLANNDNLTKKQMEDYEKIIKKQYKGLMYEIEDDAIDGNSATVILRIEVKNFKEIISKYDKNNYSLEEYHDKIIKDMQNTKETITYTLGITLTKRANDNWEIDPLSEENKQKLLGIY